MESEDTLLSKAPNVTWRIAEDKVWPWPITSEPDITDPRVGLECSRCGSKDKLVETARHKTENPVCGPTVAHKLSCGACGKYFCNLQHKITKKRLKAFRMPIGRHTGMALDDIDNEYLEWCSSMIGNKNVRRMVCAYLGKEFIG